MTRIELEAEIAACKAAGADPLKVEWADLETLLGNMLLNTPIYNVKDYGLTDDNTGDNSTAFASLMDEIPDGASIYFPGGGVGYRFTSGITVDKNVIIYGDGYSYYQMYTINPDPHKGATNLFFTSPTSNFITITSSVTNECPIVHIRDLTIKNTALTTPSAGNGIIVNGGAAMNVFERLTVDRFYNNIKIDSHSTRIFECHILGAIQDSIILGNTAETDYGGYLIFNNYIFSGFDTTAVARGIVINGGGGSTIANNNFNAQNTLVVNTSFIYQIYSTFSEGLTSEMKIINNHFNNYQTNGIRLRNVNGAAIGNILIAHNEFAPLAGSSTEAGIDIDNFTNLLITDNIGNRPASDPKKPLVKLANCSEITLGACQITNTGYVEYELGSGVTDFKRSTQSAYGLELIQVTKTERDALVFPSTARVAVYQTDNTPGLRTWNGTNWIKYTEATD